MLIVGGGRERGGGRRKWGRRNIEEGCVCEPVDVQMDGWWIVFASTGG